MGILHEDGGSDQLSRETPVEVVVPPYIRRKGLSSAAHANRRHLFARRARRRANRAASAERRAEILKENSANYKAKSAAPPAPPEPAHPEWYCNCWSGNRQSGLQKECWDCGADRPDIAQKKREANRARMRANTQRAGSPWSRGW